MTIFRGRDMRMYVQGRLAERFPGKGVVFADTDETDFFEKTILCARCTSAAELSSRLSSVVPNNTVLVNCVQEIFVLAYARSMYRAAFYVGVCGQCETIYALSPLDEGAVMKSDLMVYGHYS